MLRWFARIDTGTFFFLYEAIKRNTSDCSFGLLFDLLLSLRGTVPVAQKESSLFNLLLKLLPSVNNVGILCPEVYSLLVDILLQETKIEMYDLIELFETEYGLRLSRTDIISKYIPATTLHYDSIMDTVYVDYDTYFEEI